MILGLGRLTRLHGVPYDKGQTERVNQTVKGMLRACVLDFQGKWEEYHPLAEFSYDKGYQATIKMAPFKGFVWPQV
jgi:hypothetical protein